MMMCCAFDNQGLNRFEAGYVCPSIPDYEDNPLDATRYHLNKYATFDLSARQIPARAYFESNYSSNERGGLYLSNKTDISRLYIDSMGGMECICLRPEVHFRVVEGNKYALVALKLAAMALWDNVHGTRIEPFYGQSRAEHGHSVTLLHLLSEVVMQPI